MRLIYKINILFILLLSFIAFSKEEVKSKNSSIIELIYNNESYLENEEIILEFNMNNIFDLYEVDLKLNIDEAYFSVKEELFTFKANSVFKEDPLINDYIDNVLRLKLVKLTDIFEGYNSNIKNNLTTIKLKANKKITSIKEILMKCLNIKLFDIEGNLMDIEIDYNEQIKYSWNKNYNLLVGSDKINFYEDIKIINRTIDEYEISLDDDINYSKIGNYLVNVIIYDYLTNVIIKITKDVKILDSISPTVETKFLEITLSDKEYKNVNLNNYFSLKDNYDNDLKLITEYYTKDKVAISKDEFFTYLESNLFGLVTCYTKDSSGNISNKISLPFNVIDTESPIINIKNTIDINVDKMNDFKIMDYINVFDQYDQNPLIVINYFDDGGKEIFDIDNYLIRGISFYVKVYAIDSTGNISTEYKSLINVVDNISPSVVVNNINLEDKIITGFNYLDYVMISDNLDSNLEISFYIYKNDELIKIINSDYNNMFIDLLNKNLNLSFYVSVKDKAGNITTSSMYKINVLDTTAPFINFNNNKILSNINELNLNILDNYSSNIEVEYYINEEKVTKDEVVSLNNGTYLLKVVAIDEALNRSEVTHEFSINSTIEKNNNKFDFDNNLELIVIGVLFIASVIILIVRLVKVKKYQILNSEV